MGKILSIAPTWQETIEKIKKQGYVYIKMPKQNGNHWIHKENVTNHLNMAVCFYPEIILSQKYYGITFALTIEELCDEFVFDGGDDTPLLCTYEELKYWFNYSKEQQYKIRNCYGAIWTDKGLIYVAKMNNDGKLELI